MIFSPPSPQSLWACRLVSCLISTKLYFRYCLLDLRRILCGLKSWDRFVTRTLWIQWMAWNCSYSLVRRTKGQGIWSTVPRSHGYAMDRHHLGLNSTMKVAKLIFVTISQVKLFGSLHWISFYLYFSIASWFGTQINIERICLVLPQDKVPFSLNSAFSNPGPSTPRTAMRHGKSHSLTLSNSQ